MENRKISEEKNILITKNTQKRLIKDITDIMKNSLIEHGIYYAHDEENILKGYALIIGPTDSIYEDGYFFFEFKFPHDYPFTPPKISFKTQGDNIRFHPNLYRNGKVCLSILNTWTGPGWTSCQTIRSILLTLVTLFHNKSLLNEPGVTEKHRDFVPYHKIIEFKNYDIAINSIILQDKLPLAFLPFFCYIKQHFLKKYNDIIKRIKLKKISHPREEVIHTTLYRMTDIVIDYKSLKKKLEKTYNMINSNESIKI